MVLWLRYIEQIVNEENFLTRVRVANDNHVLFMKVFIITYVGIGCIRNQIQSKFKKKIEKIQLETIFLLYDTKN